MSHIEFESDTFGSAHIPTKISVGLVSNVFVRLSFGYLKTKRQISIAQIIFVIFVGLVVVILLSDASGKPKPPSQDLINAAQPIKPL